MLLYRKIWANPYANIVRVFLNVQKQFHMTHNKMYQHTISGVQGQTNLSVENDSQSSHNKCYNGRGTSFYILAFGFSKAENLSVQCMG